MADRCPTCGRAVPNVFEHIDAECQDWPDRSEDPEGLDHLQIRNLYEPEDDA
jgi:hypothetical protein